MNSNSCLFQRAHVGLLYSFTAVHDIWGILVKLVGFSNLHIKDIQQKNNQPFNRKSVM